MALAIALTSVMSPSAQAQQETTVTGVLRSPVLSVDSERLYASSEFGERARRDIETQGVALAAENEAIRLGLEAEERDLTEKRAEMAPEAFRDLADVFDIKVQRIRREQDAKSKRLNQMLEQARVDFLTAAAPVLEEIMREAGAAIILERRDIFLSANVIDITDVAIERVNAAIGAGEAVEGE